MYNIKFLCKVFKNFIDMETWKVTFPRILFSKSDFQRAKKYINLLSIGSKKS
jgi:hypothetical protein